MPAGRLKPERGHKHRLRLDPPDGPIVRGRCGCGHFRVVWADADPLSHPRNVTPVEYALERGRYAWQNDPEVARYTTEAMPEQPAEAMTITERVLAVLKAANGEYVRTRDISIAVFGTDLRTMHVGPTISFLRDKYGREAIVSKRGEGYAWRGAA